VVQIERAGLMVLDGRPITAPAGAMGLIILMPETYAEIRQRHGLGADPDDPHDNILAGTAFLREMYDCFGYPGVFAAYNAGPQRYGDHLAALHVIACGDLAYLATIDFR
jgi:soluble lytic murein transglycosylase-like protein